MTERKLPSANFETEPGHSLLDEKLRVLEALLFASPAPLSMKDLSEEFDDGIDIARLLTDLGALYSGRGVNLVQIGQGWAFRTAEDLAPFLTKYKIIQKKLSKVALETLAIIAYHQPVTRAEIEDVRGVQTSKGTLDVLLETGWVKMRGRRRAPGRPITYGTTENFLDQFGLARLDDLPGLGELKGAGLLDGTLPPGFEMPVPSDLTDLTADEDPLELEDLMGDEEDPLQFNSRMNLDDV